MAELPRLPTLPEDALSLLSSYLPWQSLGKLTIVGNQLLRARIASPRVVQNVNIITPLSSAPLSLLLEFRSLRTLEIRCAFITTDQNLGWIEALPSTLQEIRFFSYDADVLWRSPPLPPSAFFDFNYAILVPITSATSMKSKFPELRSLKLSSSLFYRRGRDFEPLNSWTADMSRSFLEQLPDTLTELETGHLANAVRHQAGEPLKLPPSLTSIRVPDDHDSPLVWDALPAVLRASLTFYECSATPSLSQTKIEAPQLKNMTVVYHPTTSLAPELRPRLTQLLLAIQARNRLPTPLTVDLSTVMALLDRYELLGSLERFGLDHMLLDHDFAPLSSFSRLTTLYVNLGPSFRSLLLNFSVYPRTLTALVLYAGMGNHATISLAGIPPRLRSMQLGLLPPTSYSLYHRSDIVEFTSIPDAIALRELQLLTATQPPRLLKADRLLAQLDTLGFDIFNLSYSGMGYTYDWDQRLHFLPSNITRLHLAVIADTQIALLPPTICYLSTYLRITGSTLPATGPSAVQHLSKAVIEKHILSLLPSRLRPAISWSQTPTFAHPDLYHGPIPTGVFDAFEIRRILDNVIVLMLEHDTTKYDFPASITSADLKELRTNGLVHHLWRKCPGISSTHNFSWGPEVPSLNPVPATLTSMRISQFGNIPSMVKWPPSLTELVAQSFEGYVGFPHRCPDNILATGLWKRVEYARWKSSLTEPPKRLPTGYIPDPYPLPPSLRILEVKFIEAPRIASLASLTKLTLHASGAIRVPFLPSLTHLVNHSSLALSRPKAIFPHLARMTQLRIIELPTSAITDSFIRALPSHISSVIVYTLRLQDGGEWKSFLDREDSEPRSKLLSEYFGLPPTQLSIQATFVSYDKGAVQ